MDKYKVYVRVDKSGVITAVNSSAFLPDATGWIEIDQGIGDRYHHAQGNYLEKGLVDEHGRYNYRYVDGQVVEIPETEKPPVPEPEPPLELRNRADIDYIGMMTGVF